MEVRWLAVLALCLLLMPCTDAVRLISSKDDTSTAAFALVTDVAGAVSKRLGLNNDDVTISKIDTVDAKIGQSVVYEVNIEVGGTLIPVKLSEEVTNWKYVVKDPYNEITENTDGGEESKALDNLQPDTPVLSPFEIAGPVELWISDAEQMRLAVPNDVEAGILNRVMLADGAVVTVEGAREVSLSRPLQLPLPLVGAGAEGGVAASLIDLASRLRFTSQIGEKPILSLRIVGPSSLVAAAVRESGESDASASKLKVKRLAPGAVELVSGQPSPAKTSEQIPSSLAVGDSMLWPLPSLNGSNAKLLHLERALKVLLGKRAYKRGSFKLLGAKASAATFVRFEFELERKLNKTAMPDVWPEWATLPSVDRYQFEVLAMLEGQRLVPVTMHQLEPVHSSITFSNSSASGNVSYTNLPMFLVPPGAMTL